MRPRQIERPRRCRDVPLCSLECAGHERRLEPTGLLLKRQLRSALRRRTAVPKQVRRLDGPGTFRPGPYDRHFDCVGELADVARPLCGADGTKSPRRQLDPREPVRALGALAEEMRERFHIVAPLGEARRADPEYPKSVEEIAPELLLTDGLFEIVFVAAMIRASALSEVFEPSG